MKRKIVFSFFSLIIILLFTLDTNSLGEVAQAKPLSYAIADSWRIPLDGDWTPMWQDFNGPYNSTWQGYHLGQDIGRTNQDPVYAAANGRVKYAGSASGYQYVVLIEHTLPDGSQYVSLYGHMQASGLTSYERDISKGELIGYLNPDDNHLHFAVREGSFTWTQSSCGGVSRWLYTGYTLPAGEQNRNNLCYDYHPDRWRNGRDFVNLHSGSGSCYSLGVSKNPDIAGSINRNPNPNCGSAYTSGTVVTIQATSNDPNYNFSNWSGSVNTTANPTTVTMDGEKSVVANFVPNVTCYSLGVSKNPDIAGSINRNPNPNCGSAYTSGTVVTIQATSNDPNYNFSNWSGSVNTTANPTTITMDGEKSVVANFVPNVTCYSLGVSKNPDIAGSINRNPNPNCGSAYTAGTVVTIQATSNDPNYYFSNWSGSVNTTANPTTITMDGEKSVVANFAAFPPDLIVQSITSSANNPVVGQPLTITVRIKNQSSTAVTSSFHASLMIRQWIGCGDYSGVWWNVSSLGAGATRDLVYSMPSGYSSVGPRQFYAVVDTGCVIAESNENNNTLGPVTVTINQANTATTVTTSQNPAIVGQSVAFTATVGVVAPGNGSPTGAVTFYDGTNSLGVGALSGGIATYTTSALTAGSHSITAVYGGDTNFSGSTSAPLTQIVTQPNSPTQKTMPVWRALLLVYHNIDANYTDSNGTPRHLTHTMPQSEILDGMWSFRQFTSIAHDFSNTTLLDRP